MTIRVAIVDDQELVRAGFSLLVDSEDDMTVVAAAGDGVAATRIAAIRTVAVGDALAQKGTSPWDQWPFRHARIGNDHGV